MYDEYWWVHWLPDGLYYARCMTGSDTPAQEGECPDWESLPAPPGARLVLSVSGSSVRIHPVKIPARSRRRFLDALPFALEDLLLRSPESYHFVPLSKPDRQLPTPVAVVEHEQMAAWTGMVEERGWRLEILIPEYMSLPEPAAGTWLLDGLAVPLLLRFPGLGGGAALNQVIDSHPPGGLLLALEQAQSLPRRLEVHVRDSEQYEQVKNWQSWLDPYDMELDRVQAQLNRSARLARQPLPSKSCNLLTGSYRPSKNRPLHARRFIPAAALAASLVLVLVAQWLLENARVRAEHDHLNRTIEDTYREAFPDARHLVDPRHQMEQQLAALREQAGTRQQKHADILLLLEQLAPYIGEGTDALTNSLEFDGRQLILELDLPDLGALETLQEHLAGSFILRVEDTELKSGRVHSRIYLEMRA